MNIRTHDMPKIESPFVREMINNRFLVTNKVAEGYEWVFEDDSVMAIEKLHGTNVSILVIEGNVIEIYNRTERIPFINKNKDYITLGILESFKRGYIDFLGDGQHFGELIGERVNGNPYKIVGHLWIPFSGYAQEHLRYKSWGKYPKDFDTISNWFKDDLFSLLNRTRSTGSDYVEGVVFTHPDGRMAKLRRDMYTWYVGEQHGQ